MLNQIVARTMVLLAIVQMFAIQNILAQNNNLLFRVTIDGVSKDYAQGDCGYGYADGWGGNINAEICGTPTWAYDITPDSLACDTITESLNGYWALVRRGACNMSQKAFHAQQAGAVVVIIVNNYDSPAEDGCTIIPPPLGTNAALVTVPVIFIGRAIGESIGQAINAGKSVALCFLLPRLYHAVAAYHYATPVSQVDTLQHIGVRYVNRSGSVQNNVILKADIQEPGGNIVSLTRTILVDVDLDTFVYFPSYLPPAVLGRFEVTFSNSVYNEVRDSMRRSFQHTPYTFATDNLTIDPGGVAAELVDFLPLSQQSAGLCRTGPNGGVGAYVTFGLANAEDIAASGADNIVVLLYDADPNNDGTNDLITSFTDLDNLTGGQLAYAIYTVNGTEPKDSLITVALTGFNTSGPILLKPRHLYYISLVYDVANSTTFKNVALSKSREELYLNFPTTPLLLDQLYTGFPGSSLIQRLQLEGYPQNLVTVQPAPLEASKVVLTPNPANDQIRLNINLAKVNDAVTVMLIDWTGRFVSTQLLKNFQNGQTSFNVAALPAGNYLVQVSTSEGTTMRKVTVAH